MEVFSADAQEMVIDKLAALEELRKIETDLGRSRSVSICSSRDSSTSSIYCVEFEDVQKFDQKGSQKSMYILHFLKRLLDGNQSSIIQWVNQSKGVFKIMDPAKMLAFWNDFGGSVRYWNHFA